MAAITKVGSASFSITCTTPEAKIYYTLDGGTPSASSTLYESKVTVKKNVTVKAIGIKEDMTDSDIASQEIRVKLPTPELAQSHDGDQGTVTLTNTDAYAEYTGVTYQVQIDGEGEFETCTFPYTAGENGTYVFKAIGTENDESDTASIEVSVLKVDTPVITVDE